MSIEAMKALAVFENKASREYWADEVRSDLRALELFQPDARVVNEVIAEVAVATGLTTSEINGRSRIEKIVRARQFVYFKAHQLGIPAIQIGACMHRDHSTVLHGIKAIEARLGRKAKESR